MSNLLDVLRVGGTGLESQQIAAQVIGNNISNAHTPGYHRQDVSFIAEPGLGGVRDVQILRATNQLLENQINTQKSQVSYAQNRSDGLSLVVAAVGDFSETGLNAAMTDLFNSWRQLSAQPDDLSVRAEVLTRGNIFSERVQDASSHLAASSKLADDTIINSLSTVNDAITQVANLNVLVKAARVTETTPSALLDQRDGAVQTLASFLGTTSVQDADGSISVLLDGISIVSSKASYPIVAERDAITGHHHLLVDGTTQGIIDGRIRGGSVGAQIALRDNDVGGAQSQLDQFAYDVATAFNNVHAQNFGLDGATGRNFFAQPGAVIGAAEAMSLSVDVRGLPAALATSASAAGALGDNAGALDITALEQGLVAMGATQTLGSSLTQLISFSGRSLADAINQGEQAQSFYQQTQNLWEQQQGVSLDEQMLQLSRIQNAYQAAAKLISTVDRMLEVLQRL